MLLGSSLPHREHCSNSPWPRQSPLFCVLMSPGSCLLGCCHYQSPLEYQISPALSLSDLQPAHPDMPPLSKASVHSSNSDPPLRLPPPLLPPVAPPWGEDVHIHGFRHHVSSMSVKTAACGFVSHPSRALPTSEVENNFPAQADSQHLQFAF